MIDREYGDSHIISELLMVTIVIIITAILLLYYLGMLNGLFINSALAPPYIKVTSVLHTTTLGKLNMASRIFIENTNTIEYRNQDLIAVFFKNGKEVFAEINTLHGEGFIPTQHYGVATIGGAGCRGEFFSPGEKIEINLKDGLYIPGDEVELMVYQKSSSTTVTPFIGNMADIQNLREWAEENFHSRHPGYRIISQHKYIA